MADLLLDRVAVVAALVLNLVLLPAVAVLGNGKRHDWVDRADRAPRWGLLLGEEAASLAGDREALICKLGAVGGAGVLACTEENQSGKHCAK